MKAVPTLAKYFQKTVSGTQKYVVAPGFSEKMRQLKLEDDPQSTKPSMPSRTALRKHPYYLHLPPLTIPDQLDLAAADCLREYNTFSMKHLKQLSTRLVNYLHDRELLSEADIIERVKRMQQSAKAKAGDEESFEETDCGIESALLYHGEAPFSHAARSNRQFEKASLSSWRSLSYNDRNSLLYLVGRLAPNFTVACRVLYEIRKRCPLFIPHSFFDFASGLGTYTWAVNTIWPVGCVRDHHLVEPSGPMTLLSEFMLAQRGQGVPPNTWIFPGVHHRRFMPSSQVTADLAMSGYALLEMAGESSRRRVVESLWARTTGFLVLIEEGTKAGHAALLEARDWLINNGGDDMHIFAPCPHKMPCGRMGLGCNSPVRYYQFGLTVDETYASEEAFSYLVLSRGDWRRFTKEPGQGEEAEPVRVPLHPRIVNPGVVGSTGALDVDLCLPNGDCERVTFSKSGTERSLFFFLRHGQPGDIAPCERLEESAVDPESEEDSPINRPHPVQTV